MYQLRETLFDKNGSFRNFYTDNRKLFNNLAIIDFERMFFENEALTDIETTTWIGNHIPTSVSISPNFIDEHVFRNPNLRDLVSVFIDASRK